MLVLDAAGAGENSFSVWQDTISFRLNLSKKLRRRRETYSAVGSAVKGIVYYQWRADYPYADGPEPEGFGIIYNNKTPTAKYDRALRMNALLNKFSSEFACVEKVRSGVAILFSNHATAYFDALDNYRVEEQSKWHDRYSLHMRRIYSDFRKAGFRK